MARTEAGAGHRRRRLLAGLVVLAALLVLLALGTWQVRRLAWKQDLIHTAETGLQAPPQPIGSLLADPGAAEYRRVRLQGSYRHDLAFALGAVPVNGVLGAHLITPLLLEDGRALLVDRGWLPEPLLPPHVPDALRPTGTLVLEGVARDRGAVRPGWFTPASRPDLRRWYGWDLPAMAGALGLPLLPLVVTLERPDTGADLPRAEPVVVDLPNNHLGYAITWYGLAAGLVAVSLAYRIQSRRS